MTEHALALFLNAASLAIIVFSGHVLLQRTKNQTFYWPLLGCLLAIAVLIAQPWLTQLAPELRLLFLLLALPALYLLPPCFWLYVQGLTSCTPWHFQASHAKHFAFSGIALVIVICALLLPAEIRHGLLVEGNEQVIESSAAFLRHFVYGLLILTFGMVIGWCVQAGYYVVAVFRQLHRYRAQLKQVFASTETQELRWILWLLLALIGIWLFVSASLLYHNLVVPVQLDPALQNGVTLLLVWTIAGWGLRQKPGFAELYQPDMDIQETQQALQKQPEAKYQRSALNEQLAASIVHKLHQAMMQDQLFLDAALSLPKLAKHIATSPSYISQTLNETLGVNFFDYVNRFRVEAAKIQLLSSDDTVLDIAMNVGFNAKSSFYTAFKKETQLTPNQFRKTRSSVQDSSK
jgi:AraC-like DNA-binding protein